MSDAGSVEPADRSPKLDETLDAKPYEPPRRGRSLMGFYLALGAAAALFGLGVWLWTAGRRLVSADNLGKRITVQGGAVNSRTGAKLVGRGFELWIDNLNDWPEGFRDGKVRVTGVLAEDHGLPVFVPKRGEFPVQGMPVPEGTDLEKASHRYVLKDAKWALLEKSRP
jgi:hypothetical protein